jgi:para-nitrobenzyl esterase
VGACFLEELGVEASDSARLRSLPVADLLAAQLRTVAKMWRSVSGLTFQPVVDGEVLPAPPLERIRSGCAAGVSLLVGSNRDEYKLWHLADPKARELDHAALLRRCQRNIPGEREDGTSHAARAIETYVRARQGRASVEPPELWTAIETDRLIRAPALRLAELQSRHQPQTYAYLFTWMSPAMEGVLGSCHALEIPFVFGTLRHPGISAFVGAGPAAERLSSVIQAPSSSAPAANSWTRPSRRSAASGTTCSVCPVRSPRRLRRARSPPGDGESVTSRTSPRLPDADRRGESVSAR